MGWISRARFLGLLLVIIAAVPPVAQADTVFLANGNLLVGQVDATELPVATPGGIVQVPATDVLHIAFATITGADVLVFKKGTTLGGVIQQPAYSVRLASGQTVVIERSRITGIRFHPR